MIAQQKVKEYVVYASGEVFLIVVGILIAIQLNNWNQSISTSDQKLDMLAVLQQNFQLNEQEIRETLTDYETSLRITNVRIANTGPGVLEANDSIINQVRQIDKVKMSLAQGASTASLMQFQNVSLLSNEILDLLLVYSAAYEQYKGAEQNVEELTMKLRQNHQQYVALLTESTETDAIPVDAAHLFPSDYLGWLRDRDHQNLAVEIELEDQAVDGAAGALAAFE